MATNDQGPVIKFVERFQCPGCVVGMNTQCGKYMLHGEDGSVRCTGHVLGTFYFGSGSIALGLPKGFCRAGFEFNSNPQTDTHRNQMCIRLWKTDSSPKWNHFNVPVWALEGKHSSDPKHHGFLFVRTFMPRVNATVVDVIEGGTLNMVPQAVDVSAFYEEMD